MAQNSDSGSRTTRIQFKHFENRTALLFILPVLIPLVLFWLWPMTYSLYISFTDWDYMSPEYRFVGLSNYGHLLHNTDFLAALKNTMIFSIGTVVPTVVGGLMLALLLNRNLRGIGLFRTIFFSPWVTPTVAVSIVWAWLFEPKVGLVNYLLQIIHLPKLQWAQSAEWAMVEIIIFTVWKGVGWAMVFYLSALHKVPKELYEACDIDGGTDWQKFKNVTLPLISPTTFFLIVITTIDAIQAYDQIQIITQGGPAGSTRTLLYLYYQAAFERFNMGEATAVATVLVLITVLLGVIQFVASKRWVYYR
ncbi:multiple sugar transport system permease protein [Sporomusaceae bacterium BoRhaA]|uniref:carbohydrate ABC transporter permease n=1 Tax=Pelorhabdus rhamnosifermentans TaxID=2772457 RepID=UPI001C064024|nr:sugar ABC transporter permease [Pelorhabdus rhamnosifermentans]MBU2699998.1 multiple sugar transport system permease protein [Pelorhabdus rhamnosifermentans]